MALILRLKEMLFESVDKQGRTAAYPVGFCRALGSDELKSINSVQAYIMNISIKS